MSMTTTAGALRIFDWLVPAGAAEAHAFAAGPGIPFRSACEGANWSAKAERAAMGPLCPVCTEIVRLAANHLLGVMLELERAMPVDPSALWHEVLDR